MKAFVNVEEWTDSEFALTQPVYLGIDPGSSKTGLALVDAKGQIVKLAIVLMDNFAAELRQFIKGRRIKAVVLGDGTTSGDMQATIKELLPQLEMIIIHEAYSTQEARNLFWQVNPPTGWRKLVPLGLQSPPVNLDSLAAVVLVRRYLQGKIK